MFNPISITLKIGGIVGAGIALAAGWRIGEFIADVATGDKTVEWPSLENVLGAFKAEEPLWKRKFGPVS